MSFVRNALLLAVVLVAGGALVAPPPGPSCGVSAAESSAVATLKFLVAVEEHARTQGGIDRDHDGIPEHVGFVDAVGLGLLARSFVGVDDSGVVTRSGYHFVVWLPRRGGGFVRADAPAAAADVDPVRAASEWRAYAWPAAWSARWSPGPLARLFGFRRDHGVRAVYCVDPRGDVRAIPNADRRYEAAHGPAADAVEHDAERWVVVG